MRMLKNLLSPRGLRTKRVEPDPDRVVPLAVCLYETDDAYHVVGDAPGVERDGVELIADGSRLTIRAAVAGEEVNGYQPLLTEYGARRMERVVTLPEEIDLEHAQASLHDGSLHVVLPRTHRNQARRIPVARDNDH
ncbi:MAG TPA: Hsp20/alpha crystallin family protein [Planctomycetota bacterium]|nr:Hsp20/alpha crystallin family protein [Planctomycetota bacterium]